MATGDNIIEVGAVIDLSQILPGLQELVTQTQATTSEMRASLEQLDAPVKVGAIAPTPAAVGVTPESIQALSNVTLDLTIKQEALKASVADMIDEIAKEGGTEEVAATWTKRLADEELALGLVDQTVANAERSLAEARGVLIDQSQLALLIQQQLKEAGAEQVAVDTEQISSEQAKATAVASTVDSATAATSAAVDQIAANVGVAASSADVVDGAAAQATAVAATGTVSAAAVTQSRLVNQSAKDLAVSLMASGKSADEAAKMIMQAGVSSERVNAIFVELGKPLKAIQAETGGVSSSITQMITAQKAAGASAIELARTMQLAGLSGREIATQLQGVGFTVTEVSQAMAQLGIKVTGARNEVLRMAADAGATREQLEALRFTIDEVSRSTSGMANNFGVARLEMGALDGSTGMMAGGLARIAAASKTLGPLMQAAFPLFAAYAMVTILVQMWEGFKKLSDVVMGYTEEVQKAEKANIKASEAAEVHGANVEDAYRKMGRTAQDQSELAGKSWTEQAEKGENAARQQHSRWLELLGPLSYVYEGYILIKGALDGLTDSANRAAKEQEQMAQHHADVAKQMEEQAKNNLKLLNSEQAVANVGKDRVDQIEQEIAALSKKEALEKQIASLNAAQQIIAGTAGQGAQFEAAERVAREFAITRQELTKKLGVAELEERIAEEKALTEAEKAYGLARITQAERLAQEQYAAGKINLDKETSELEANEIKKFNLEKSNLEKRRAIAESERGAGKDPTAEIDAINGELRTLAVNHEAALTAIKAQGVAERRRIDEEYQRAVIAGETKINNETVIARKDALKVLFEDGNLSEANYTKALLDNEQKRTDIVRVELSKQRDLINTFTRPDEREAKLKEADDAEAVEVQRHEANIESIKAASQRRQNAEERKNLEVTLQETIRVADLKVAAETKVSNEHIQLINRMAQHDLITFGQKVTMTEREINLEHQKALAILQTALAEAEAAKAAAVGAEAQELAGKKIIEIKERILKLSQEYAGKEEKLADEVAEHQMQQADRAASVISSSFTKAFDTMLTTHTNFKTVMTKFWNDMVLGFAQMGLQIVANWIKHLAMMVIQTIIETNVMKAILAAFGAAPQGPQKAAADTSAAESKISANTGQAASDVFLQAIESVPFPENLAAAPAASALVIAEMGAFAGIAAAGGAAGGVGSAAEGALLDKDMLVSAHAKEMILPPSISEGLQRAISTRGFSIPTALQNAGALSAPSGATTSTSNTYHVRPQITVHQHGDASGRMSTEEIAAAVNIGMRRGFIKAGV